MREVLLFEKQDLRIVDSPIPECGPNDVLVKIKACGICPTDLRKYHLGKAGSPLIHLPMNLGHEWTGEVIEAGVNVDYPSVGMRIRGIDFCGYAEYTSINIPKMFKKLRNWGFEGSLEDYIVELPDNVSYEEGTFVENITISMHALIDQALGGVGKKVVIIGAGQMGLTQVWIGKLMGVTVIVTDLVDWRLELAKKLGADYTINIAEEEPVEAVKRITKGKMADAAIITVGIPSAIYQGLNIIGNSGRAVLFGGASLDTTITFNPNILHYGDKALVGCSGGPARGRLAIELLASKNFPVQELYSHTFKLEELPEAFKKITGGKLEKYLKGMVTV
ncbi:MAG: zinc-binding dehydrogenase [Nitrososphaeria archaeon]